MTVSHEEIYARLTHAYGLPPNLSGRTPWELLIASVLSQSAAPKQVDDAVASLTHAAVLTPQSLEQLSDEDLTTLIRPAGNSKSQARKLKILARFLINEYEGSVEAMVDASQESLREKLLALKGIGPETADRILLHVAGKPTFPLSARVARVFKRHGWLEFDADYAICQEFFSGALESDVERLVHYHVLLDRIAGDYCRTRPHCEQCPLRTLLPEQGPLEIEWA
jgi:endonuclease-3 related protein